MISGFAVGFAANMFGYCSAIMNPAAVVAEWVKGEILLVDVFPLMLAEVFGGFLGQLFVFATYWPHYAVVPDLDVFDVKYKNSSRFKSLPTIHGENAAYHMAVKEDQDCKLSSCSTMPAIPNTIHNFICELICTFMLVLGLSLMGDQFKIGPNPLITSAYAKGTSL